MTKPAEATSWGIIRYAACSGAIPDEDAAGFDGWYICREDAFAIAEDWHRRFPQWTVALVSSDLTWFGNGDFSRARNIPLTAREKALISRLAPA
jgi:hypothetical protein